jgi:hypothetical protein
MLRVLREIRDGRGPFFGVRSLRAFRGRDRTLRSLYRLKLIDAHKVLTHHGRDALDKSDANGN